jgi:glycerol kinase
MAEDVILAIDQGTTGSKALLLNAKGIVLSSHTIEFKQIFPQSDFVEHNPEDIWSSVSEAIKKSIQKAKIDARDIKCIGITNQRETTVIWDKKTKQTLLNAIVWQCKRTIPQCKKLKEAGHEKLFHEKTGLMLDPYFSGTKMKWLLDNIAISNKKDIALGTVDSFLLFKLTDGVSFATEPSNASRTLLCNFEGKWDQELLDILEIPLYMLPKIKNSNSKFGITKGLGFLPDGIPISGMLGDQQSALMGQACFSKNEAKCTYGTGSFIMMNIGNQPIFSQKGLLTTIAWKLDNNITYALEGSAFIAGAAIQWLRDGLGIINHASEIESLASSVSESGEVCFVPALSGLGSPYWQPQARGLINGITRATNKAHIARATLEGIAMQNYDIIKTMNSDNHDSIKNLFVDGGASANNLLMQIQADVLDCKIYRPTQLDTTAIGACFVAGLGHGIWSSFDELQSLKKIERVFTPSTSRKETLFLIEKWQKNIQLCT